MTCVQLESLKKIHCENNEYNFQIRLSSQEKNNSSASYIVLAVYKAHNDVRNCRGTDRISVNPLRSYLKS